jgi:hypothetical protein
METIIAAGIGGVVTLIVCIVNNHYQSNATRKMIEYKLDELTKRVDKHNNVVERTYALEQKVAVIDEKMKVANHRITDAEADLRQRD